LQIPPRTNAGVVDATQRDIIELRFQQQGERRGWSFLSNNYSIAAYCSRCELASARMRRRRAAWIGERRRCCLLTEGAGGSSLRRA
jgi:hypothetical protein